MFLENKSERVLIVEEDEHISQDLCMYFKNTGYTSIVQSYNYSDALKQLQTISFDLIIIPVNLEGSRKGIALADCINSKFSTPFIFTCHKEDVSSINESLRTKPHAYLTKPFNHSAIYSAMKIAFENKDCSIFENDLKISNYIFLKNGNVYSKLNINEILFLKSKGNYVNVYTKDKEYIVRETLKNIYHLLKDKYFYKVHKSYIVNLEYIHEISTNTIKIQNHEIPVSGTLKEMLLKEITVLK